MSYPHTWPPAEEIARLVEAAQACPTSSSDALLVRLRPCLVSFFTYHLSGDTAEDLAQAALVRITRALPKIEPARADRFIVTVAWNLVRTAYARQARDQRRWAPEHHAEEVEAPTAAESHVEFNELADALHRVIKSALTPAQREIVLGLLRDESPAEIAERLQISPVTVRTRLLRARAILRCELSPYLNSPEPDEWDQAG